MAPKLVYMHTHCHQMMTYMGGGGLHWYFVQENFDAGLSISHEVPNLLWEILHPHALSLPLARLNLLN